MQDASFVDRTFLAAMAVDDGPPSMADIARRMGVDAQYAGTYRRRLIEAELIAGVRHGYVDFELPYLRDYLKDHITVDAISGSSRLSVGECLIPGVGVVHTIRAEALAG
ncbi:hypothetical protein [Corynebacterium uterequi]|uniref:Uncharacterized protein n=1 Tax=Corynebacterium uterequi TaxID=1072256 RepID=A0A0G3H9P0_9CORY|nr:hypothetical protein [Corynebacterium uterequi]AKK10044.1 hypothetical protein CUTER_00060 [Corynebacterium uterequi]